MPDLFSSPTVTTFCSRSAGSLRVRASLEAASRTSSALRRREQPAQSRPMAFVAVRVMLFQVLGRNCYLIIIITGVSFLLQSRFDLVVTAQVLCVDSTLRCLVSQDGGVDRFDRSRRDGEGAALFPSAAPVNQVSGGVGLDLKGTTGDLDGGVSCANDAVREGGIAEISNLPCFISIFCLTVSCRNDSAVDRTTRNGSFVPVVNRSIGNIRLSDCATLDIRDTIVVILDRDLTTSRSAARSQSSKRLAGIVTSGITSRCQSG